MKCREFWTLSSQKDSRVSDNQQQLFPRYHSKFIEATNTPHDDSAYAQAGVSEWPYSCNCSCLKDIFLLYRLSDGKLRYTSSSPAILFHLLSDAALTFFQKYHGQYEAHLTHLDKGSNDKLNFGGVLLKLLSPLLFFGPNAHLCGLQGSWVHNTLVRIQWERFFEAARGEWADYILYVCPVPFSITSGPIFWHCKLLSMVQFA